MPQYTYTAVNAAGKEQKGKILAATPEEATEELKKQQLFITSLKDPDEAKRRMGAPRKAKKSSLANITIGAPVIKRKELVVVTRQLATLLDAGLPLIRSLRTLERQAKNKLVANVLGAAADTVETGATFAEALAKHPKSFDKLYLNMIRAGEASGAMEIILNRLATFMEKSAKIAGKVKSAMIYPAVVLSIAGLVTAGLMIFIVPNFQKIFGELLGPNEQLPGITMFVMNTSKLLKDEGWIVLVAIAVLVILYKLINANKYGRLGVDWIKYNMPLFGPLISRTAISQFSRTLGTLMSSGVPVLNALIIVRDTASNSVVSGAIQKVHDAVKEGEGIAAPMSASGIFPAMVISMVEVGEETGRLPDMLDKIADTYDEEVDNAVGALTSMIEPLMIVGLAVVVGTIVVALFLPLAKMIEKMS